MTDAKKSQALPPGEDPDRPVRDLVEEVESTDEEREQWAAEAVALENELAVN